MSHRKFGDPLIDPTTYKPVLRLDIEILTYLAAENNPLAVVLLNKKQEQQSEGLVKKERRG